MTAKPLDAAGTAAPASPVFASDMQTPTAGRTVAEVRNDPAYTALFAEAESLFQRAEDAYSLAESFDAFRQAVRIMRIINAAELQRQAQGAAQ